MHYIKKSPYIYFFQAYSFYISVSTYKYMPVVCFLYCFILYVLVKIILVFEEN